MNRRHSHLAALVALTLFLASALPASAACACGMPPASACCTSAASSCCDGDAGDGPELRAPACERHVLDLAPDASLLPTPASQIAVAGPVAVIAGLGSTADPPGVIPALPAQTRSLEDRVPVFLLHSVFRI